MLFIECEEDVMKTILVPVDFSDVTEPVVELGQRLARAMGSDVVLLHVAPPDPDFVGYEPGPPSVREHMAEQFRDEHQQLHALKDRFTGGTAKVSALLIQGTTVEKILQESENLGADLIILGSHGHGALHQLLVGSVAEGVLRNAPCPVLMVPAKRA
jgi:nucleotide-binding universal stress UspA family protein